MKKKSDFDRALRIRFQEDEERLPWLPLLLDAYAIFDTGVRTVIKIEKQRHNRTPACMEGCSVCCSTQTDIAVYPLELVGIYWYSVEKLQSPQREILQNRLSSGTKAPHCPFLIDNACVVYPVRPAACRQFTVFGSPCAEGEDPFFTRRDDVLTPIREYTDRAFFVMLPFYGISDRADRLKAVRENLIHSQARNLQECNWRMLATRMLEFNPQNPPLQVS